MSRIYDQMTWTVTFYIQRGEETAYMVKRGKYKLLGYAALFFLCLILHCGIAFAADNTKIMEKYAGESEIVLYVKGSGNEFETITAQIGTDMCDTVEKYTLSEANETIRTLIMLDNTKSIPKKDRKKILKIIRNIISDREDNEQISIAVLNKDVEYLTDYTSDYEQLKNALKKIRFRNTKTYLTDVIYEWVSTEYIPQQENGYHRILVIADGTDNKPIGYIQDELYSLLKEHPVPIYTVGVKTKNNNENLENMFALSRATNADSFLLDDIEDVQKINSALQVGRDIFKIQIQPQAELLDGNRKSVKIFFSPDNTLSAEIIMPQMVHEQKEAEVPDNENEETVVSENENSESEDGNREELAKSGERTWKDNFRSKSNLILAAIAGVVLLVSILLFLILRKKKEYKQPEEDNGMEESVSQMLEQQSVFHEDKTEVAAISLSQNPDRTVVVWNPGVAYQMILQDVNVNTKSIEFPLKGSAIIGRKSDMSDIAFENDRTVSGRHCKVAVREGRFYITDLKSSNGTYINGRKVVSEMEIFPGDMLRLGKLELKFDIK